jgi:uncharacterized protein
VSELEQVVREFYRAVSSGDSNGVLNLLSDDICWTIPGPSVIPYAGTFHGKDGVAEFFRILAEHEDLQSFVANQLILDEPKGIACVLGCETAVAIKTGRTFTTSWSEIFWVSEGQIAKFEEHIDTFELAEAYRALLS